MEEGMELEVVEELYVKVPPQWVFHHRSKNYVAKLIGLSRKFGFERRFLDTQRFQKKVLFAKSDFVQGEIYEMRCIYYTGGGKAQTELDGLYRCVEISDTKVSFSKITVEEAIRIVRERYPSQVSAYEEETRAASAINEAGEAHVRMVEAQEIQDTVREARNEFERMTAQLNIYDVAQLREELAYRIRAIALRLLRLGASREDTRTYTAEEEKIKIKEEKNRLSYVCVDDAYVISQYDKQYDSAVSLKTLLDAFKRLREHEAKCVAMIEKEEDELFEEQQEEE